jgi:orotate phosphoribosyltransferase
MVVLLDREQGGQENLRKARIEPHLLFKISDAMSWLHTVNLIASEIYETIKQYIEEERKPAGPQSA